MKRWLWTLWVGVLSLAVSTAQNSCPAIVNAALDAVDAFCQEAGRNEACYGNIQILAQARDGTSNFQFTQVGDIVSVTDIARLDLAPMNEAEGVWGVALMRLQANLPDSAPGQNVTFLLFGDVSIAPNPNAGDAYSAPMQAFYLRTGIGDAPCAEAPSSGLIVQTPQGAQTVAFNVNGVDVQMGSTILFRAEAGAEMTVSALEGAAVMQLGDTLFPVIAGTWARMKMDENLQLINAPDLPVAYRSEVLSALPLRALQRRIEARPPLNEEELAELHKLLREGKPPCAEDSPLLPRCETLPLYHRAQELRDNLRWASGAHWGQNAHELIREARERMGEIRENLQDLRGTLGAPINPLATRPAFLPTREPRLIPTVMPPRPLPTLMPPRPLPTLMPPQPLPTLMPPHRESPHTPRHPSASPTNDDDDDDDDD